jgi:hypothetical protein
MTGHDTTPHPDDPGPMPPDEFDDTRLLLLDEVPDREPDPDLADGVCTRCGTPLELDGCSTANVRLRGAP